MELPPLDYPATIPGSIRRAADRFGDRDFVVMPDRRITYAQADTASRRVAKELLGAGIGKGTRVAMMDTFSSPPAPSVVDYESVDAQWTQWDWTVSLARPAVQQFSHLYDGGPGGFTLDGAGTATVTTPAAYQPGSTATVTVAAPSGTTSSLLTVDGTGRLTISVPLSAPALGLTAPTATARVTIQAPPAT